MCVFGTRIFTVLCICQLQITWSRLEDDARPYSLLTIGEENYIEDKRFLVVTTQKGLTDVSIYTTISTFMSVRPYSAVVEANPVILKVFLYVHNSITPLACYYSYDVSPKWVLPSLYILYLYIWSVND